MKFHKLCLFYIIYSVFHSQPPLRGDLLFDTRGDRDVMSTNFSLSSGMFKFFFGLSVGFNRDFIVLLSVWADNVDSVSVLGFFMALTGEPYEDWGLFIAWMGSADDVSVNTRIIRRRSSFLQMES